MQSDSECVLRKEELNTSQEGQAIAPTNYTLHATGSDDLEFVESVIGDVICVVCAFGLVGNVINILVLNRRGLGVTMERLELSAHYCLMALAVSDSLFCLSVLPRMFLGHRTFGFVGYDFRIWYAANADFIINSFILSSTWLIVVMATSRYIVICHPIRARGFVGRRFVVCSIACVSCACALVNIPRYFRWTIRRIPCLNNDANRTNYYYYYLSDPLEFDLVYNIVYFVIGIMFPFVAVACCNSLLIRTLRRSVRMRTASFAGARFAGGTSAKRISLTLVVIVAVYMPLVVPAEVLTFFRSVVLLDVPQLPVYNLLQAAFNLLQAINFSFNFLLYCAVNQHFRHTFVRLVCAPWSQRWPRRRGLLERDYRRPGRDLMGPSGRLRFKRDAFQTVTTSSFSVEMKTFSSSLLSHDKRTATTTTTR